MYETTNPTEKSLSLSLEDSLILTLSLDETTRLLDYSEAPMATSWDTSSEKHPIRRKRVKQESAPNPEKLKKVTRKNAINLQRLRFQTLSKKLAEFVVHSHHYTKVAGEYTKDGCDMCSKKYGEEALFECEYECDAKGSRVSMCRECSKELSCYHANVIHGKITSQGVDPMNIRFVKQVDVDGFEIGLFECSNCDYDGPVITYDATVDYSKNYPGKVTHRWTSLKKQTIHLCPQCNHELKDQLMASRRTQSTQSTRPTRMVRTTRTK
jgi:hypothetical protein